MSESAPHADAAADPRAGGASAFAAAGAGAGAGADAAAVHKKRREIIQQRKLEDPLFYGDYLCVDKLLSCQHPKSREAGCEAHDEHLFIVIHQVYELWFKQILHEVNSIVGIFATGRVPDKSMFTIVSRLTRVTEIQRVLIDQLNVLETMSPLDFLDFRDVLFPASGFQSVQFRVLENKLGLRPEDRLAYGKRGYCSYLQARDAATVAETEREKSLFDHVQDWLERTPFLDLGGFEFWSLYEEAVDRMLQEDRRTVDELSAPEEVKAAQYANLEATRQHFQSVLSEEAYNKLLERKERRLSYRAMKAALLITLYSDEPIFQLPCKLLSLLVDMDKLMTSWRHRHAIMVHRMLGIKMGTGGSSGYHYLKATAERHQVFSDFFNLSTFLIPRFDLPELPAPLARQLHFHNPVGRPDLVSPSSGAADTDSAPAVCPYGHTA